MGNRNIGKIIYTLRTCNQISQEKLARGICSVPALSRIEANERIPDKMLLDALLQRLGKSPDKLESIISLRDYKLYLYRRDIQAAIVRKDYNKAKKLLSEYEGKKEAEEKVHKQYILKIKATLCELMDNDAEGSKKYIDEAISITMPKGGLDALENNLLSACELQLLLMRISHYDRNDGGEKIWELLKKLNQYVKEHYTDEEELVKIYVKIARAEVRMLMECGRFDKVLEICESTLELLGRNGVLTNMRIMISMMVESLRHLDEPDKLKKALKWEEALRSLYKEYGIHCEDDASFMVIENSQSEILLVNETIQRGRKAKGMTQETLSEDICTPENLSAIESGRRAPSIRNYDKLMAKLGMDKDYYNSFISGEQFEIYELRRECSRLIQHREYKKAQNVLQKIEQIVDTDISVNRQYILYNQILLSHEQGKLSTQDALQKMIDALELTLNYNDGDFDTDIILSQEEVKIINYICVLYKQLNQAEKAISVYRRVVESYRSGKASVRGHYTGSSLIMANLSITLEENNQIEESMEVARLGISQVLECGRGSLLADFLANIACCYEKINDKKACTEYLRQAFYISDMMRNEFLKNALKEYYEERFGKVEWY